MRIAVLLGSQRPDGNSAVIERRLGGMDSGHELDFIRFSELSVRGCVACEACAATGRCVLPADAGDAFDAIVARCAAADCILVVTPIYSPYPSRLTAFLERLTSVSFFPFMRDGRRKPLFGKRAGIVCYGSSKIEDEKQLKILFQKCLMDDYSFSEVSYGYVNEEADPNGKYRDAAEYVADIVGRL